MCDYVINELVRSDIRYAFNVQRSTVYAWITPISSSLAGSLDGGVVEYLKSMNATSVYRSKLFRRNPDPEYVMLNLRRDNACVDLHHVDQDRI